MWFGGVDGAAAVIYGTPQNDPNHGDLIHDRFHFDRNNCWFRDANPTAASNFTDGVSLTCG